MISILNVIQGFSSAIVLIVAIGAQNAFVLGQGVQKHHHWWVALVCMTCDAVLISAGMLGGGYVFKTWPLILELLRYGGAAFLIWYAYGCFKGFLQPKGLKPNLMYASLKRTLLTTLAVSLLNPHVYIDTVVLLGSIGNQLADVEKQGFWFGAVLASITWFTVLVATAGMLSPILKKPQVWRWIDLSIGCLMLWIAFWLLTFE
jgi:L-lysine exporter family protein LysE/ArgO